MSCLLILSSLPGAFLTSVSEDDDDLVELSMAGRRSRISSLRAQKAPSSMLEPKCAVRVTNDA